jgi:hypothetical protein
MGGGGSMSNTDESHLGLLLRAHAECAAQAHGEEYVHGNIPAKCDYEMALQSIHSVIRTVVNAETRVAVDQAKKNFNKERNPNVK